MRQQWAGIFLLISITLAGSVGQAEKRRLDLPEVNFGARAAALGGNLASAGDDVSTLYWNPGGLVFLTKGLGLLLAQDNKFALSEWREEQTGIVLPLKGRTRWGIYRVSEKMALEERENGGEMQVNPWQKTRTVLVFARQPQANIGYGVSISQVSENVRADGWTRKCQVTLADLGFLLRSRKIDIGFTAHNLNVATKDLTVKPDYHFSISKTGARTRIFLEVQHFTPPQAERAIWGLGGGVELAFTPNLLLRAGQAPTGMKEPGSLTLGLGLKVGGWSFDYAYLALEPARTHTHYLSTGYQF